MNLVNIMHKIPNKPIRKFVEKRFFDFRQATWRLRPLPYFLIIGAQKSGTTSFYEYLGQYPQLFSSPYAKELHFFNNSGTLRRLDFFRIPNQQLCELIGKDFSW